MPARLCSRIIGGIRALSPVLAGGGAIAWIGNSGLPPLRLPLNPGTAPVETARGVVRLTALFAATNTQPVHEGVQWRVFEDVPDRTETISSSRNPASDAKPAASRWQFYCACRLGARGRDKAHHHHRQPIDETLCNAGGLRIAGQLGERPSTQRNYRFRFMFRSAAIRKQSSPSKRQILQHDRPPGRQLSYRVDIALCLGDQWFIDPDEFGDQR